MTDPNKQIDETYYFALSIDSHGNNTVAVKFPSGRRGFSAVLELFPKTQASGIVDEAEAMAYFMKNGTLRQRELLQHKSRQITIGGVKPDVLARYRTTLHGLKVRLLESEFSSEDEDYALDGILDIVDKWAAKYALP